MLAPTPSPPDSRDYVFKPRNVDKPAAGVDLRDQCPGVYNQGKMMSCTVHAVAAAFEFDVIKQGLADFSPSRLFLWYNARRQLPNDPKGVLKDVGCYLRAAIKSLDPKAYGVCSEEDWPYVVAASNPKTHFFVKGARAAQKPPAVAYKRARQHTLVRYWAIPRTGRNFLNCLDQGYPFIFGVSTYGYWGKKDAFSGGILRMPTKKERSRPGNNGHSLLAVGYRPKERVFIVRNSWGEKWREDGYFYMPYAYVAGLGYDFWTIRAVTGQKSSVARAPPQFDQAEDYSDIGFGEDAEEGLDENTEQDESDSSDNENTAEGEDLTYLDDPELEEYLADANLDKTSDGDDAVYYEEGDDVDDDNNSAQSEEGDEGDKAQSEEGKDSEGKEGDEGDKTAQSEEGDEGDKSAQSEEGKDSEGKEGDEGDNSAQSEEGKDSEGKEGDEGDNSAQSEEGDEGDNSAQSEEGKEEGQKADEGDNSAQSEEGDEGDNSAQSEDGKEEGNEGDEGDNSAQSEEGNGADEGDNSAQSERGNEADEGDNSA